MAIKNRLWAGLRLGGPLCLLLVTALVGGCGDIGYYAQCASGHFDVLARCTPIKKMLVDPDVPSDLKEELKAVQAIRDFASAELGLPENDSYRSYGDLGRPYVVWNVVGAAEFSLSPRQWCFPVAGCVSYRGYFKREQAEAFAATLQENGDEVYLYGVPAYSTLNWFDDPVLNTFLNRPEPYLAGMIFHELAHQQLYVQDDSQFNEAFATAVEIEGVYRWLKSQGRSDQVESYRRQFIQKMKFLALLARVREELAEIYASGGAPEVMRRDKREAFARARKSYDMLKESWGGDGRFDHLMEGLNNARLASVSTYYELVPSFKRILSEAAGDFPVFYRNVAEIGKLPRAERHARLLQAEQIAQAVED